MPGIDLKPLSRTTSLEELLPKLIDILQDLEAQLNEKAALYTNLKGETPKGLIQGDLLVTSLAGKISIKLKNTRSFDILTSSMLGGLTANGFNFLGEIVGTIDPPTSPTVFPNAGDFGFYRYKTTNKIYFCYHASYAPNILKYILMT
jgi:hypothetical protein